MSYQYRPDNQNLFTGIAPSAAAPPVSSRPSRAPFPPNTSAPPFMSIPPPHLLAGPPPNIVSPSNIVTFSPNRILPQQNVLQHPVSFPPPPGILPPINLPPPVGVPPLPPTNIPPPFNIPPNPSRYPPPPVYPTGRTNHPNVSVISNVFSAPDTLCPPPTLHATSTPQKGPLDSTNFHQSVISTLEHSTQPTHSSLEVEVAGSHVEETKNLDEVWLDTWLSGREKKISAKTKNEGITVCRARLMIRDALHALSELKITTGFLQNSTNCDQDMWQFKLRKALQSKEKLESILKQFSSKTNQHLKKKLKKIKAKRARIRRQHLRAVENQDIELQNREKLHSAIDAWQNEIQERVRSEKKKEELKSEADNILSEVRKKLQEAKKVLDHLDVLEKLRAARLENSEKKGLKISSASSEHFQTTVKKLRKLMEHQLHVYETEERALKVMLETEREQERQDRQQQKLDALNLSHKEILQCLFSEPPDVSSPVYFYWQYYMRGHSDLEALLQIRQQWDMLLVPEVDTTGSSVPLGWILPKPPSSSKWECFLDSSDKTE